MVIWSEPAKDDLRQIYDYIARGSHYYAEQTVAELIEKTEPIESFPFMGRVVPELMEENVREILSSSYRIIYEILPDLISVLAVIHTKRDFDSAFEDRRPSPVA
ncbi:MAG: hypothetical protein A2W19_02915 [Spirochaetes bacterium RBG_16_49_21]|nr:MAG: hypothetical protein A2W19_02915 [Spirochaetes bacterium RBG_16_49_21]